MNRDVSHAEARRIARWFQVSLPRVGYEMSLGEGRWIRSTGHAQFGWFESTATQPFTIVCRCEGTCPPSCPNVAMADCTRTACTNKVGDAPGVHRDTKALYCIPCARRINEDCGEQLVTWEKPAR